MSSVGEEAYKFEASHQVIRVEIHEDTWEHRHTGGFEHTIVH